MTHHHLGKRRKSFLNQFKSKMKSWNGDDGNTVLWKAMQSEENVSKSAKRFADTTGKGEQYYYSKYCILILNEIDDVLKTRCQACNKLCSCRIKNHLLFQQTALNNILRILLKCF